MQRITPTAAALLLAASLGSAQAQEHHEAPELLNPAWPHEGVMGTFDRAAAQRGFQVYREVCASCHSLEYFTFRNLAQIGFSEEQIDAIAAEYEVEDGPDENGEMFMRPAKASDRIPGPFANEQEARMINGGALPPDLSLITKARADGTDYLFSLMQGYTEPPEDFTLQDGMSYNQYFPGHQIAMVQPLSEGQVEYMDGTEATLPRLAADITTFLTWVAEPKLEVRKQTGLKVLLFLVIFTGLVYATKRRVWADAH